jgi:hypothetical protein
MEFRQPCQVNRFALERHAVGDLLGNRLPTHAALLRFRQPLPALNGFDVTHAKKDIPKTDAGNR